MLNTSFSAHPTGVEQGSALGSGMWKRKLEAVEAEARKFYRFRFHIGYLT